MQSRANERKTQERDNAQASLGAALWERRSLQNAPTKKQGQGQEHKERMSKLVYYTYGEVAKLPQPTLALDRRT